MSEEEVGTVERLAELNPLRQSYAIRVGCRRSRDKEFEHLVSCPRNKHIFRCDQNGPPARRYRRSVLALLFREAGKARTLRLHIATLWAAASWLFLRVARSSRIDLDMTCGPKS